MIPQDTPEYRAIEQAAEKVSDQKYDTLTAALIYKKGYIAGATSPEAERFWKRWIPVTERLPEHGRYVSCYGLGGRWFTALFSNGRFIDCDFEECEEVTHWQEITAP